MRRREWLAAVASLAACAKPDEPWQGGWIGASADRGHRLRDSKSGSLPPPAVQRRAGVLIIGAGIAGLATARRLQQARVDDVHLLELEDEPGGNSRGHRMSSPGRPKSEYRSAQHEGTPMGGLACPLGAHYLPTPGNAAPEIAELLDDYGLRRVENGRVIYDERVLCHSPQERLFIDGHWQDGLLPMASDAALRTQYQAFGHAVDRLQRELGFAIPTARAAWSPAHDALDAIPFTAWLDAQGLSHPKLRWYLDYCCRDDYGASSQQVSAWAGIHYFASRHGFHVDERDDHDAVLTWPEGNAWLTHRLAEPMKERLHTGRVALRVSESAHAVEVDVWHAGEQRIERWTAPQLVLALPLFIAARLVDKPPPALADMAARQRHAPWLVANLLLKAPLADRLGAPMSWDNVLYDDNPQSLGYVDATHQSLSPVPDPVLLTAYWALGGRTAEELTAQRHQLLTAPWADWAARVVADLARAHPDLPRKLDRIDLMRYGHAMSIPTPGLRGSAALQALASPQRRIHFAHSDLSAYSVFEEAFFHGHRAGGDVAAQLRSM